MGGKTWQEDEEKYFWLRLVPVSPEGLDPAMEKKSWGDCAAQMQLNMGSRGHRKYSKQMVYEHFYQNCVTGRMSPRSRRYVIEYMRKRGDRPIERAPNAKAVRKQKSAADAGPQATSVDMPGFVSVKTCMPPSEQVVSSSHDRAGGHDAVTVHIKIDGCSAEDTTASGKTSPSRVLLPLAPIRQAAQSGRPNNIRLPSVASLLEPRVRAWGPENDTQGAWFGRMSPTTRISSDPVSPKSKVGRSATKERCSKQHHVPGPFQDDNTNNYCSEGRTADTASVKKISGFEALLMAADSASGQHSPYSETSNLRVSMSSKSTVDIVRDMEAIKNTLEDGGDNKENQVAISQ